MSRAEFCQKVDANALAIAAADAKRSNPRAFLFVPGSWLASCGYGDTGRVFPVLQVNAQSDWWTFATVDASSVGGMARWVVHVPCRGATFQSTGELPAPRGWDRVEADDGPDPSRAWSDTSAELR